MLGIEQTKEMLSFMFGLANVLGKTAEDGKISFMDLPEFIAPLTKAGPAFVGANVIITELADLDDTERKELLAYAKAELEIPQKKVEAFVENALEALSKIHEIIVLFRKAQMRPQGQGSR